jgi:hypothetical protein
MSADCEHGGHWRFGSCKVEDEFVKLVHRGESIDTWQCKLCGGLLYEDPGTLYDLPPEQRPPGSRP